MARCKSCRAEIVWVKMKSGNDMPCNPNLIQFWANMKAKDIVITPEGDMVHCNLDGPLEEMTGMGYVPHWATCPFSKQHKKKK